MHYPSLTLDRPASAKTSRNHSRRNSIQHVSPTFVNPTSLPRSKPSSRRNSLHKISALPPRDIPLPRSRSDSRRSSTSVHHNPTLVPDRPLSRSRSDSRRNTVMAISALDHDRPSSRNSGKHSRRSSVPQLSSYDLDRFPAGGKSNTRSSAENDPSSQRKLSPQSVPASQRGKLTRFAEHDDIIGHVPRALPPLALDNESRNGMPSVYEGPRLQHSQSARYPRPSSRNRDRSGHNLPRDSRSGPRSPKVDPDGPHFRHKRVPSREEHIAAMAMISSQSAAGSLKSASPSIERASAPSTSAVASLATPTASSDKATTPSPTRSPKPSRPTLRTTPVLREGELYDEIGDMDGAPGVRVGFHHPHRTEREVYMTDHTRVPSPPRRSQTSMGIGRDGYRRPSALDTGNRSQSPSLTHMTRAESVPPSFSDSPRKSSPRKRKARSAHGRVHVRSPRSPHGPGGISLGRLNGSSPVNSSQTGSPRTSRANSTGRYLPQSPRSTYHSFSPHSPRSPHNTRMRSSSGGSRDGRNEYSIFIDGEDLQPVITTRMSEPVRSPRQHPVSANLRFFIYSLHTRTRMLFR